MLGASGGGFSDIFRTFSFPLGTGAVEGKLGESRSPQMIAEGVFGCFFSIILNLLLSAFLSFFVLATKDFLSNLLLINSSSFSCRKHSRGFTKLAPLGFFQKRASMY